MKCPKCGSDTEWVDAFVFCTNDECGEVFYDDGDELEPLNKDDCEGTARDFCGIVAIFIITIIGLTLYKFMLG